MVDQSNQFYYFLYLYSCNLQTAEPGSFSENAQMGFRPALFPSAAVF